MNCVPELEPHLQSNEGLAKSAEIKNIISTLEAEYSKSARNASITRLLISINDPHIGKQVNDILRDRLQIMGGELIEAKSRVTELENVQGEDRTALSKLNVAVAAASKVFYLNYTIISTQYYTAEQLLLLTHKLEKERTELHKALCTATELETKLASATERLEKFPPCSHQFSSP